MILIDIINKRRMLKRKLRGVRVKRVGKFILVTKDGNKLGKRKDALLLSMYFEFVRLKQDVNSLYGAYCTPAIKTNNVLVLTEELKLRKKSRRKHIQTIYVDENTYAKSGEIKNEHFWKNPRIFILGCDWKV